MPPSDPPAHNRKRKASKPAKWGRRALAEAAQWAAQLTNWMPKKGLPRARQIAAALAKLGGQKAKRKRGKSSIRPTERLGTAESAPVVAPATPRETEVLKLIVEGYTNRQIGEELNISVRTVEGHRANLSEKLGLQSRVELVRYAREHGLIE